MTWPRPQSWCWNALPKGVFWSFLQSSFHQKFVRLLEEAAIKGYIILLFPPPLIRTMRSSAGALGALFLLLFLGKTLAIFVCIPVRETHVTQLCLLILGFSPSPPSSLNPHSTLSFGDQRRFFLFLKLFILMTCGCSQKTAHVMVFFSSSFFLLFFPCRLRPRLPGKQHLCRLQLHVR